jgi:hypothetical protein
VTSWFVSTTRTLGGSRKEVEWLLEECPTEQAAKEFASKALTRGLRVEAGTLPGIEPRVRVRWRAAHHWAQSSNENAIKNLQRRTRNGSSQEKPQGVQL